MEIKLLNKDYRKFTELYNDFIEGKITEKEEYISEEIVTIENVSDFPIYMGMNNKNEKIMNLKKHLE